MTASAVFTPCTDVDLDAEVELNSASLRLLQNAIRAELPTGTKLVAMMLCCHHNNQVGAAWPSPDRLAKLCGMHRRTVVSHLSTLKNMGLALVGKIPGVRTPAYALQENTLQSIAIAGIKWSKNMLCGAESMQPPTAPSMVNPAKNAGITIQGTEGTEDLKELGGTEDARATPPAPVPAPAPATPAKPEPAPALALFASHLGQPEQPTAGVRTAPPSDEQTAIALVNTQRISNGKKPLALADLQQLRTEAIKAGITTVQAANWILERTGRNFFHAEFFAPPVPAPVAPAVPAQPAPQPAEPAPVLTPEQSAKQEAAAAAAKAKLKAMFAQPASAATPAQAQAADALVVPNTGHAWADSALAEALAGEPVGVRRLEMACQLAKVSYSAVRAAQKRAATALVVT